MPLINTYLMLYLEFLSRYDGPFDFFESQLKLKAINRSLKAEPQNFVPATSGCCPHQL
jgi:hypothetical protein